MTNMANFSKETLTLEQFVAWLDARGADLTRWPAADAERAEQLLEVSDDAKVKLREARSMEMHLDAALPPLAGGLDALKRRVLARVAAEIAAEGWVLRFWHWLAAGSAPMRLVVRPAVLAMIPLLLGFALGMSFPASNPADSELTTEMSLLAFTDRFEDYQNVR